MQLRSLGVLVMGEACHCCNIRRVGGCSSLGMHPIVAVAVAFPLLEIGIESLDEGAVRFDTCCDNIQF